ncbi:uncharacterized protein Z518_08261 [Rhinocladiella mackenziei CBS 650.93]|uniref:Aldehyde dehydrogenase domain-containing protein n=1 Tax=Rhinocladiella mackenziei CBS 650.93 TaxID=1442369 RepID=A0A0D2J095_9EURO|nr:uncharacterized protein Z518_08261 [Rhinocladiella mackenziei CBS 650.93]KIX02320.1 hypothetical protein Z518_08261 [Rhinocladiella mackenziei CBS 650.93]
MKQELSRVKVGPPEDFESFLVLVIHQAVFDKITEAIDAANNDSQPELVTGDHLLFDQELFGPVVVGYVYPDTQFDQLLGNIDKQGGGLALTRSIFATDQAAI